MTVAELIEFLKTQPQDLQVAFQQYSENVLLEKEQITIEVLGVARPDGWVPNRRSDKPAETYLLFPGN